jgi:hypothetical protein
MNYRSRVRKLEDALVPAVPVIIGATVSTIDGAIRQVVYSSGMNDKSPPGLTREQLPPDCFIHEYDPRVEVASIYRGTDGIAHVQRMLGVNEFVFLGEEKPS